MKNFWDKEMHWGNVWNWGVFMVISGILLSSMNVYE